MRSLLAGAVLLLAVSTAAAQRCPADCDGDAAVSVDELIRCVAVELGGRVLESCPACDADGDGAVAIQELVAAVDASLGGCGAAPRPCCVPTDNRWNCAVRSRDACAALGGVVQGGTVCQPETCADVLPPDRDVRCCLGDRCEARSTLQCAAAGGVNRGAGSCAPDTCDDVNGGVIQCCVPEQSDIELECQQRTAAECDRRGGINTGPGDCDPDPCTP